MTHLCTFDWHCQNRWTNYQPIILFERLLYQDFANTTVWQIATGAQWQPSLSQNEFPFTGDGHRLLFLRLAPRSFIQAGKNTAPPSLAPGLSRAQYFHSRQLASCFYVRKWLRREREQLRERVTVKQRENKRAIKMLGEQRTETGSLLPCDLRLAGPVISPSLWDNGLGRSSWFPELPSPTRPMKGQRAQCADWLLYVCVCV